MADSYSESRVDEYIIEKNKYKKRGIYSLIITISLITLRIIFFGKHL